MNEKNKELLFKSLANNTFRFRCHPDIECFTSCCQKLDLVLTPYDIIRLKHRLDITSDIFLDKYTETRLDNRNRFPMLYLKMDETAEKRCPFVTPEGCSIYEDRPSACRVYPLGRATAKPVGKGEITERFFLVEEDHCLGFKEEKQWTPEEWISNEGLDEFNAVNDLWMEIITSQKDLGDEKDIPRKMQMFSMASYNINRFREFIFGSKFLSIFDVKPDLIERLASDDKELLLFSFRWLNFSLFGQKSIKLKRPI